MNCFPSSERRRSLYFSKASPSLVCSLAFSMRVWMVWRATLAAMMEKNPLPFLLKTFSSVVASMVDVVEAFRFLRAPGGASTASSSAERPLVDAEDEGELESSAAALGSLV